MCLHSLYNDDLKSEALFNFYFKFERNLNKKAKKDRIQFGKNDQGSCHSHLGGLDGIHGQRRAQVEPSAAKLPATGRHKPTNQDGARSLHNLPVAGMLRTLSL